MTLFRRVLTVIAVMVLLLFAVGLMGGVGTVELSLWSVALAVVLFIVVRRSRVDGSPTR
jgi:hypothetical protein